MLHDLHFDKIQWAVICLHELFQMTPLEISSILQISEGTVCTQLRVNDETAGKNQVRAEFIQQRLLYLNNLFSTKNVYDQDLMRKTLDSIHESATVKSLQWSNVPWYLRVAIEGFLSLVAVLGIIFAVPRFKDAYDRWVEHRGDLYSIAEFASQIEIDRTETSLNTESSSTSSPLSTKSIPDKNFSRNEPGPETEAETETEFLGKDSDTTVVERTYRVLIKAEEPESLKSQVMALLNQKSAIPLHDDPANFGSPLPGGISFDVFVPSKMRKELLQELPKLGKTKIITTKAKERGLPGKAHIRIWIQRI